MGEVRTAAVAVLPELVGFNLDATLFGGQAFRWRRDGADAAVGWIGTRPVRVRVGSEGVTIAALGGARAGLGDEARRYFDVERDYAAIERRLLRDARLARVTAAVRGVRILRQSPFETLVAFVVSANNNIPRIARSVEAMCRIAGTRVECSEGTLWTFPEPKALAEVGPARLREEANLGYRDSYVAETARLVATGAVDLDALDALPTPALREALTRLPGVGPKVADCVALFAYGRIEVFPVDTWVRRAMTELYLEPGVRVSDREIAALARRRFGDFAGIAQQYLFEAYRRRRNDE
jgi:N-glycosylase/DNA lyase